MNPSTAPAPAVAAFLRGAARRASLLVLVQAGGPDAAADRALQVASRVFASEAGQSPIAAWPRQFWRLLLAAPVLRRPPDPAPDVPLPGIARLPAEQRAAVLLHLVAGLDEADAAAALGIGVAEYQSRIRDALPRDVLGQPDLDVWRVWRAHAERELARMPEPTPAARPPAASSAGSPPVIPAELAAPPRDADAVRHARRMRWLWLGLLLCVLAMAATFVLHPRGRELIDRWRLQVRVDALPPAEPPRARFDPADIASHPDCDLLAAPAELALARELPLLAWLTVASAEPEADAVLRGLGPEPVATRLEQLPAPLPPTEAPGARLRAWETLAPLQRARQRGAWAAWHALPPADRSRLRAVAMRWSKLPEQQRIALRTRFDALPHDLRHGGWLGPRMMGDWARVAPLFGFVPEAQRPQLLQLLADAGPEDVDALERLAQSTPPEAREAVRFALLKVPPARRRSWILQQLQR